MTYPYEVKVKSSVVDCESFNSRGVPIINCWNIDCSELGGTTFHFDCVRPALVEVEVLFCRLCTFHCDCAGIARQAFQYSGSVAYLFPLGVHWERESVREADSFVARVLS